MESIGNQLLLATGGYDHTIKLWQAHTGNCIRTLHFVETSVSRKKQKKKNFVSLFKELFI